MPVIVSTPPVARSNSSKTKAVTDNKSREIVRQTNIAAACAVADIIRTTLGEYRGILAQAIKNQCDIDILCDTYPGFHDVLRDNHQHAGATNSQINCLPISTIKGERLDDACMICLETSAAGDVMRHLPCLHNFHKECIDAWLRRKNACPLCRSAIT